MGFEGLNQVLLQEAPLLALKVMLTEPIGYTTNWTGRSTEFARDCQSLILRERPIPDHSWVREQQNMIYAEYNRHLTEWGRLKDLSERTYGED
jgi:hypothetical protein